MNKFLTAEHKVTSIYERHRDKGTIAKAYKITMATMRYDCYGMLGAISLIRAFEKSGFEGTIEVEEIL